ncbi:signal peptidase I [Microlunatus elymi]|uniref:Signal peptidase I n=2 Tax=Microlunatus elymi TaxID=2596828 RepID=A0A516Q4V3_9ACTN|nr:signal peptidase I [Microlunatus elymi]
MIRPSVIIGWVGRILLWMIILGCLAILLLTVLIPRLAGATPYTIMTGSMRPALPPGTLVVVRPVPVERIGVGSVITYQLKSGQPTVVTHRVISQGTNGKGELRFRTQGDANDVADQAWVRSVQIRGEVWYALPFLGYPAQLITGRQHQLLVYLLSVVLLGYAVFMFASAVRDRRRPRRSQQREVQKAA